LGANKNQNITSSEQCSKEQAEQGGNINVKKKPEMSQSEVKARLRPFGFLFEKSLTDLIKGIRAHKDIEAQLKFLHSEVNECRTEVKSPDMDVKTMAVLKLCYLEMYGFDMGWANFYVLEVMSSSKFQQKRVGYLAAMQSFRNDDDVLMLTTNLLKKDLNSSKAVETGVALSGISNVVTTALASDIVEDIIKMLNHSKPYIRKKAVLAMYKIFLKYPEALRTHLQRVIAKLEDPDESVVTATVTVICELSKKTPKILVQLAPHFYELLKSSNNNWMLIRILKLFSSLTAVEPRLKSKLLNPVLELMSKTRASSLVFECVNCLVTGDMIDVDDYEVSKLCLEELVEFFKQDDSNLRYVGLLAFLKIGNLNPKFIANYTEYILQFIEDDDVTIREKSLQIVQGVVDDENCYDVIKKLMIQLIPDDQRDLEDEGMIPALHRGKSVLSDQYKKNIVLKILEIASQDNYSNLPTFEWYLAVISDLVNLSIVNNLATGEELGEQLRDIAVRVPSVRKEVVATSIEIINNESVLNKLPKALKQTIWLVGEYSEYIKNGDIFIQAILNHEQKLCSLDHGTLALYIPAIVKIYSNFVNKDPTYWDATKSEDTLILTNRIVQFLEKLSNSKYFEIQERSVEFLEFLKVVVESIEQHDVNALEPPLLITEALPSLFNAWELNPISHGSQRRLPAPDFDLESPIHAEIFDIDDNDDYESTDLEEFEEELYEDQGYSQEEHHVDDEQSGLKKKEREERLKEDPYYLSSEAPSQIISPNAGISPTPRSVTPSVEVEDKPVKVIKKKKVLVLSDEVIGTQEPSDMESLASAKSSKPKQTKPKKRNMLAIDSSNLDNFDFNLQKEEDEGAFEVAKLREALEKEKEEEVIVIRKKKKEKRLDENGNPIEKKKKKKKKTTKKEGE
jgi:AP-3 complex subunit delta-1